MHTPDTTRQDRAFRLLLAASLLTLCLVLWPFLYAFAMAALVVVVSWPAYAWVLEKTGGRRQLAAGLMLGGVILVVAIPVGIIIAMGVAEAVRAAEQLSGWLASGELDRRLREAEASYAALLGSSGLEDLLPPAEELTDRLAGSIEQLLIVFTQTAGAGMPGLVGGVGRVAMDGFVFAVTVFGLYASGPDLLDGVRRLSPIRPSYLERVFVVFHQLAKNVALGMVAASAGQGLVAAVGFWLAGVPAVVALGLLSAATSVIPVFGSAVVWVPVTLYLLTVGRWPSALFVGVWSMALTASADNVIKPFLFRNGLQVSPLLMLISLLGGLLGFGARGLVLGPFVLALYLTLYTLYVRDFVHPEDESPPKPS